MMAVRMLAAVPFAMHVQSNKVLSFFGFVDENLFQRKYDRQKNSVSFVLNHVIVFIIRKGVTIHIFCCKSQLAD